jgi:hypothetical protein
LSPGIFDWANKPVLVATAQIAMTMLAVNGAGWAFCIIAGKHAKVPRYA